MTKQSYVYFIYAADSRRIKIGFSVDVPKRLSQIQTGSPERLTLLGVVRGGKEQEAEWHNTLRDYRVKGEWFEASDEVMGRIKVAIDNDRTANPAHYYREMAITVHDMGKSFHLSVEGVTKRFAILMMNNGPNTESLVKAGEAFVDKLLELEMPWHNEEDE